jgi:beta-glucosidase
MQRPSVFRLLRFIGSFLGIALLFTAASPRIDGQTTLFERPWLNATQTPDQRANELIAQMTLAEKIAMLHGAGGSYVGNVPANTRLGIPAITLEDGPAGVADGMTGVTAFPAPVGVAASWDTPLMNQYGQALGAEEYGKGANVALAPTVNILRNPVWGRSFESLGEDPYLSSQMDVASIQGIQSQNVIATVKHFVANNQEHDRTTDSSNVDERSLHEIYLPAFQAAVQQSNVGAVMCAYNKVNDIYACEQPYTMNDVLKTQWDFPGFVMSDWDATHSTLQASAAGLDLQMPDASFYGNALQAAVQNGQVSIQTINEMVHRISRTMFAIGLFDHPTTGTPGRTVTTLAHDQFTKTASEQGTVLLQNTNSILPLNASSLASIAVIGSDASDSPMIAGNGSAHVNASSVVTPLQGITNRAGSRVNVQYAEGVNAHGNSSINQAVALAKSSSVAVVFANDQESEGADRSTLSLPFNQDQLIEAVAQANPHTIVVLNTGAPVLMPWVNQVQGIVEAWYPGQEDGNAIAAVLFGDVNPSGKLPMTFPVSDSQVPANTQAQYPGINDESAYSEGLDVGYRYYDANNLTPLFPFGYGLSYTNFAYSNLSISPNSGPFNGTVTVRATLKNTGSRAGADVAQLYVSFPSSMGEPPKQLKGFQRVSLAAGQSQTVSFTLNASAFSYWDTTAHNWVVPQGTFQIAVGDSSRSLPLQGNFQVTTPSYNSLAQAFNNTGTSDNSNPSGANFDGSGYSYSAQALAAVGLTPGAVVTHDGASFTWPNAAPGQPNNVVAAGQTIMYSGAGDTLGILGAATFGTQSGTGTITYTDGTTQSFNLSFADWYANTPATGDELLATTSNWHRPSSSTQGDHAVSVYYTSVALNPAKAIQAITLPTNSKLHVFALGLDSLQQAYNNVGISDNSNPASGNLDGHGYSYSAQALASAGLMPGSVVSHNGILFTWPDVVAGQQDNVVAAGQTITMAGSGSVLALLGTGASGTQSGTATITYTDGSTQNFNLSFADWYTNTPASGSEIAVTTTNWNTPSKNSLGNHHVSVYYSAVSLQAGKTVRSITLPTNSNLHIFSMTIQ